MGARFRAPCSTSPGPRAMTQNPGYGYFMRKETLEQPRAVRDTLATHHS